MYHYKFDVASGTLTKVSSKDNQQEEKAQEKGEETADIDESTDAYLKEKFAPAKETQATESEEATKISEPIVSAVEAINPVNESASETMPEEFESAEKNTKTQTKAEKPVAIAEAETKTEPEEKNT